MTNGIFKRRVREFRGSIVERQAAAESRRKAVRKALLREKRVQAIKLARERERLRTQRRISAIKSRPAQPGFFTAFGQGLASTRGGLKSTTIQRRKPQPKIKFKKIKTKKRKGAIGAPRTFQITFPS